MECKSERKLYGVWLYNELIDTLWNVNNMLKVTMKQYENELIDTLWNVNRFKAVASLATVSN